MAQAYYYSSVAGQYTLTIAVTGGATILNINSTTGLPGSLPYKLVLEPGTVREEIVKVTSVGGLALTVERGHDGTPATSHDAGSEIRHAMTAEDLTLARQHEAATSGVHGVSSELVGTTDAQVLSNKTVSPATPSAVAAIIKGVSGQSGDLIQFQDHLGNPLAKVDSAGNVTAPNMTTKFAALDATDASLNTALSGVQSAVTVLQSQNITHCTSTTRPSNPYDGQEIFETDTKAKGIWDAGLGKWLIFDSKKQTFSPNLTASGVSPALGAGGLNLMYYKRDGEFCEVWHRFYTGGTGFSGGTGWYSWSLPFTPLAAGVSWFGSGKITARNVEFQATPTIYDTDSRLLYLTAYQIGGGSGVPELARAQNADGSAGPGTGIPHFTGDYTWQQELPGYIEGYIKYAMIIP